MVTGVDSIYSVGKSIAFFLALLPPALYFMVLFLLDSQGAIREFFFQPWVESFFVSWEVIAICFLKAFKADERMGLGPGSGKC